MNKIFSIFLISLISSVSAQIDVTKYANNREALQRMLDSAMVSSYFINTADAATILQKPVFLKDSSYKYASGVLRFTFNYVAKYVDTTSKGALFFGYEQFKDSISAKDIYAFIKTQTTKTTVLTALQNIGDEGYFQINERNEPFIIIRKGNRVFKFGVTYLTEKDCLIQLITLAKKICIRY